MRTRWLFLFTVLLISLPSQLDAQTYTRGKQNFGITLGSGSTFINTETDNYKPNNGIFFNAGISRRFFKILYPSIVYQYSDNSQNGQYNSVSIPIHAKLPFWGIYLGKSKRYECKGVELSFIIGPEYSFNFGTPLINHELNSEFFLNAGIELLPSKSGGSRSNQKWSFHIDLIYKYSLTPYYRHLLKTNFFKGHRIGLQLSLYKYRINKFSNM